MLQEITTRRVLRFYLPLAFNSILMMIEMPVVTAGISRLPNAELNLAAYGVMLAFSWALVSLAVPLTHTGNALGRSRAAFRLLRNFSLIVCSAVTLISALLYFSPLYGVVVEGMLGAPAHVAATARPAVQLMVISSFVIGWRRFYHGVLIRHGYTGMVGWCTLIRTATVCAAVILGVHLGQLTGVELAAVALNVSAAVETVVVMVIAERILRRRGAGRWESDKAFRIAYASTLWFFLPLSMMLLLTGTMRPIITAAMTRLPEPFLSLAAFPVALGVFTIFYAPLSVLPQTVIALVKDARSYEVVIRFVRWVCIGSWLLLFVATFTPLVDLYLRSVLGVPADVGAAALPAVRIMSFYLLAMGWHGGYQGMLIAGRRTGSTQLAAGLDLAAVAAALAVGIAVGGLPGVQIGVIAYVLGFLVETQVLRWRARPVVQQVRGIFPPPTGPAGTASGPGA